MSHIGRIGGVQYFGKSPPRWLLEVFAFIICFVVPATLATCAGAIFYTIARKAVGAA